MNYRLDKRKQNKNNLRITFFVILLFILIYFRVGIFRSLATVSQFVFKPVLVVGRGVGEKFQGGGGFFSSKNSLLKENEQLKQKLAEIQAQVSNYDAVSRDNSTLKEILFRKNENVPMVLAGILAKPNQSPYDTLIIDAGSNQNISLGALVFADGSVPVGKVEEVYTKTSKVTLFSSPGQKTEVLVNVAEEQNITMALVGRGGGNFEMTLPRDLSLPKDKEVVLQGITPYVVAKVVTIISDPRDAFQKALLVSPVNISELKFVEVVR